MFATGSYVLAETGVPGFEYGNRFGLFAPAATPPAIVKRLNAAINQAMARADMRERLKGQGAAPLSGSTDEFVSLLKREYAKYGKIVRDAGNKSGYLAVGAFSVAAVE